MDIGILISLIAIGLSGYTFWKQRATQVFSGSRDFNSSWQTFNQTLINDNQLIDFERELHPCGELSRDQMKRVYFYFMRLNVAYSAYSGTGELNESLANSALNNEANLSFPDRKFIRTHVFGRGYDKDFADQFEARWGDIKKSNQYLAMEGDEQRKYAPQAKGVLNSRRVVTYGE